MRGIKIAIAGLFAGVALGANAATFILQAPNWGAKQNAAVTKAGGTVTFSHGGAGVAVVQSSNPGFLSAALAGGAIAGGAQDRVVAWTEPMATEPLPDAINPTDDRFFSTIQWAPQAVEAPAAWAMGYTGSGVRVAVIDGGIYDAHPDLAGAIDVAASRSFVEPDPAATAAVNACRTAFNCDTGTFWHGTHVSGIVAARDNTIGVVGIAPEATIVGVKALHSGSGSFGAVISAILYAATDGHADIINMSLGAEFPRNDDGAAQLISALNRAVNFASRNGTLVVVSAGNSGLDLDRTGNLIVTPAESGNAIAVSATGPMAFAYGATDFSRPASYSNFGNSLVWVAAPGGDFAYPGNENCTLPTTTTPITVPCWAFDMVLSTSRAGYTWAAGTSMAAPAASAVAALIKQKNPGISVGELKNRLAQSATDEGKVGQDNFYGRGFVNARNAVTN
jgi:lantibiotic leader peptide-processing serine protease